MCIYIVLSRRLSKTFKVYLAKSGSAQRILKLTSLDEFQQEDSELIPEVPASPAFKDVIVRSVTSEGQLKIRIPEGASVGLLRELVAGRCGGGGVTAHIRMVRRLTDVLFLPIEDSEPVTENSALLLGIDLAGVEAENDEKDEMKLKEDNTELGQKEDEAAEFDAVPVPKRDESIALLTAAMELLEDPQVQELFMSLDAVSEILAAWEPPWISSGYLDLDAQTLQTVSASTIQTWAQSFSQLVAQMTMTRQEQLHASPDIEDDEVLDEDQSDAGKNDEDDPDGNDGSVLRDKDGNDGKHLVLPVRSPRGCGKHAQEGSSYA